MNARKGMGRRFRRSLLVLGGHWALIGAGALPLVAVEQVHAETVQVAFDIPAQALDQAVLTFAEQSGVQVIFDATRFADLQGAPVQGRYAADEALRRLLRGTPVSFRFTSPREVSLVREASGDVLELGATQVQGQANAHDWVYESPRSVAVIDREQLDRNPPRHAADMLEQSAGVYTAVSQQDPGLSVNIRGLQDYGRVNMNIDGMRQNFQQSGHQQRNGTMYIDPELLSAVTIEKGATSGMGGAGVIGGVAEFSTLNARDFIHEGKEFGGRVRATTGLGGYANGTDFIGSSAFALGNEVGDLLFAASERHLGDYDPGTHGSIGQLRTGSSFNPGVEERIKHSPVAYSGSTMRSRLAKLGLNLPADQRVQLSYLRTQVAYDDANMMNVERAELWEKLGSSNVVSQNIALDYSYSPDDLLVDFKAKLYHVDNRNRQTTLARGSSAGYAITYQTDTYGLQLENTSTFLLGELTTLKANYGLEYFQDKVRPDSTQAVASGSAVGFPVSEGMTPKGDRAMGSLFANLQLDYDDWLTLDAGLRYDRYHLEGETGFNMTLYRLNTPGNPTYSVPLRYEVDREEGAFSPTFGIALKPGPDWLQLFARYGEGWRPPAVTETLISGRPHGSSAETMYPNPFLKPESSQSWEVGFNIFKQNLFTDGDALGLKVAYFDTRIDDFTYMSIGLQRPGVGVAALGVSAYVNDRTSTRFRGVEYALDYDMGAYYGNLAYTHMIGENEYCSNEAWLGGAVSPVYGSGRRPPVTGYVPNATANAMVSCGGHMGSAEHMPMDRGSLTLGTRLLDRRLDLGARARYSEGYALDAGDAAAREQVYPADWKAYTVYDLYGSYKATDNLTLRLALENVTDRAYLVPLGDVLAFTLGRGRTLQGTVEYTF
ncbi:TonB-dependent receptor [Metapseudomonas otitidis]|uniref:TonB-dependent receptor n=1 Tax=Metapseudomonas otitidis TaxID=319939 RepID=UPI001AAF4528|nr:TonB-dependent receptor [Pseudomonas otitidis]MBO2928992.1 TonB-dependent hemoglobin/transferrin/lactoferrin family receptor [Pseudomonas otitidis]